MRFLLLILLAGCAPSTGVTIHNGTNESLEISGLPNGKVVVDGGKLTRAGDIRKPLALVAKSTTGPQTYTVQLELPPPGGEAVWAIGGQGCFAEGDFTEYYEAPPEVPAQARILSIVKPGTETWLSTGPISAGPGERLPDGTRGGTVRALVHVPCDVTRFPELARSWLEMTLPEIEPKP